MHRHIQGRVYQKIYAGVLEEDALVVSPTIIRGVKWEPTLRKSSERTQRIDSMSFATSPRSFYRRCLRIPANDGGVNDKSVVSDDISF